MRNILLFFFPVVIQCIEPEAKERRVWFLLAFMMRSCVVPNDEFQNIDKNMINLATSQFYSLFERLFGSKNCTYSVHIIGTHLMQMRLDEPLTETSAFAFENFYGELRKAFRPGTVSTLKQIMQRVYLRRSLSYHSCEKKFFFSPKDTALERNSLIYVYSRNNYNMYKIIDVENSNVFICNVQGKIPVDFSDATELDWTKVGVFKEGATGSEEIKINRNDISGKVLKVCSLLITCPINVLREQ